MILLSIICGLQLLLLLFVLRAALRKSREVQIYEQFYEDTLEDVESIVDMLDALMNRRQLISDDPDIQNVYRVVVILHDTLVGYRNATEKERKKEKE